MLRVFAAPWNSLCSCALSAHAPTWKSWERRVSFGAVGCENLPDQSQVVIPWTRRTDREPAGPVRPVHSALPTGFGYYAEPDRAAESGDGGERGDAVAPVSRSEPHKNKPVIPKPVAACLHGNDP
ncbi:hypothetical protein AOLI_G00262580 [Acnodon oligacanthus]